MNVTNIFSQIPPTLPQELVSTLAASGTVKIERIVSRGHCSPPGFWYDQEQHEWVILLKGKASILFADPQQAIHLIAGDYLHIPAHTRHRVESTSEQEACIWLAVFY